MELARSTWIGSLVQKRKKERAIHVHTSISGGVKEVEIARGRDVDVNRSSGTWDFLLLLVECVWIVDKWS